MQIKSLRKSFINQNYNECMKVSQGQSNGELYFILFTHQTNMFFHIFTYERFSVTALLCNIICINLLTLNVQGTGNARLAWIYIPITIPVMRFHILQQCNIIQASLILIIDKTTMSQLIVYECFGVNLFVQFVDISIWKKKKTKLIDYVYKKRRRPNMVITVSK